MKTKSFILLLITISLLPLTSFAQSSCSQFLKKIEKQTKLIVRNQQLTNNNFQNSHILISAEPAPGFIKEFHRLLAQNYQRTTYEQFALYALDYKNKPSLDNQTRVSMALNGILLSVMARKIHYFRSISNYEDAYNYGKEALLDHVSSILSTPKATLKDKDYLDYFFKSVKEDIETAIDFSIEDQKRDRLLPNVSDSDFMDQVIKSSLVGEILAKADEKLKDGKLDPQAYYVLVSRFIHGDTLEEVATSLKRTRERVRQLELKVIRFLQVHFRQQQINVFSRRRF